MFYNVYCFKIKNGTRTLLFFFSKISRKRKQMNGAMSWFLKKTKVHLPYTKRIDVCCGKKAQKTR